MNFSPKVQESIARCGLYDELADILLNNYAEICKNIHRNRLELKHGDLYIEAYIDEPDLITDIIVKKHVYSPIFPDNERILTLTNSKNDYINPIFTKKYKRYTAKIKECR